MINRLWIICFVFFIVVYGCNQPKTKIKKELPPAQKDELITPIDTTSETVMIIGDSGSLVLVSSTVADTILRNNGKGLKYRFIERYATEQPQIGDIIVLKLKYKTSYDSLLFSSDDIPENLQMRLEKPAHPGSIEEAFLMMHKGDSAIFKVDAWNFYHYTRKLVDPPSFATANTFLTFNVRLVDIQRSDDFEYQKQERESTLRIEEQSLINRYLMAEEIQQKPLPSGIYIIPIEETEGDNLKMGDIVAIHYIASFIDGKVFDNTYQNNLPFSFKLGNGEIIPGLEEGISKLHVGEKARIIIPFSLAYQSENKGPIPPYSTLVFDVEIISANGNE